MAHAVSSLHPLAPLSRDEFVRAQGAVLKLYGSQSSLFFRSIYLQEPKRAQLAAYLAAEHGNTLSEVNQFPRRAWVEYDVHNLDYNEHVRTVVDVTSGEVVSNEPVDRTSQPYFTSTEFGLFQDACVESQLFKDAMSKFTLPEGFSLTIDPWPYGGLDDTEDPPRYMQGLVFARDSSTNSIDSNHYAYPIPIIPVMDWRTKKISRVDRLATGGAEDGLDPEAEGTTPKKLFQNSQPAEYVPELLDLPLRTDIKPLNVVQPEGSSFTVHPDNLVEWQKWRFRVGFTPREGAVLHDVCYDGRSILYRLSYSELTVPYGDPRPPYQRKQAFDFGDGGVGRMANNLELGCDCLGAIHYFDTYLAGADGAPTLAKSVVCLHEQDNGILWKHTNFRTNRAVVVRSRELVIQFVATLANYEYIFAYKLDLAGGITVETRATGIMSVVAIDDGKTSNYGNVVAPGVLAQNHQHIFAVRIDPAMDSYTASDNQVTVEESVGRPMDAATNPYGNCYEIQRHHVHRATHLDAEPRLNRLLKLEHASKRNAISGKKIGYKLILPPTQLLLADENSTMAKRAPYARHHMWVTGHRDGELYAAGEFTNQSRREVGGVGEMVERGDWFTDNPPQDGIGHENGDTKGQRSSPVVWAVFGLTHNPRVEDWPVMPVEIHQIHLRPADFFTSNPALDVSSNKNDTSVLASCCSTKHGPEDIEYAKYESQDDPATHRQGGGQDIDAAAVGAGVHGNK